MIGAVKIAVIGCGHMGSAIAKALLGTQNFSVSVGNPEKPRLNLAAYERKRFRWTNKNPEALKKAALILIAVKPAQVKEVLAEIGPNLSPKQIILSIAAGITLAHMQRWLPFHKKLARAMPNLAAEARESMSVWIASTALNQKDKKNTHQVLASFGETIEVKNEKLLNLATAISGSGPAYVAAFLETLSSCAEKNGFSPAESRLLALQTLMGTAAYLDKTGIGFTELKNSVQTKGGTTEAAFKILKNKKWQNIFSAALLAARDRAKKISKTIS